MPLLPGMKVLTVYADLAILISLGLKTKEMRRWRTRHRGDLAIHAGQKVSRGFYGNPRIHEALKDLYPTHLHLPRGQIVCIVDLVADLPSLSLPRYLPEIVKEFSPTGPEIYAWSLVLKEVLPEPVPAWGRQGLWIWRPEN